MVPAARSLDGRGRGAAPGDWGTWSEGGRITLDPSRAPRQRPREGGRSGPRSRLTRGLPAWVKGHWKDTGPGPRPRRPSVSATPRAPTNPPGPGSGGCRLPGIWNPSRGRSGRVRQSSGPGPALRRPVPVDWERPHKAQCEALQSLTKARAPGWVAARERAWSSADSDPSGRLLLG